MTRFDTDTTQSPEEGTVFRPKATDDTGFRWCITTTATTDDVEATPDPTAETSGSESILTRRRALAGGATIAGLALGLSGTAAASDDSDVHEIADEIDALADDLEDFDGYSSEVKRLRRIAAKLARKADRDADDDGDADDADEEEGTVVVEIRDDDEYGEILVDENDRTLYAFSEDSPSGKSSVCTTDLRENENNEALAELSCVTKWPPLTESDPAGSDDVEARIEAFDRDDPDGTQVSADNEPLYRNVNDVPGTVEGPRQDSGGQWFLLAPDGETLDVLD